VTPVPELASDKASASLSSTAIFRVIDGKTDFSRQMSLHQYAASLDAAAMPGAINEAMQLPLQYRNGALTVLFSRWTELDPAAAAEYAKLLPKGTDPQLLLSAAVTAWAQKDFAGAFAWVRSLEKGEAKNDSLRYLANTLAKSDPAGAIKLIKENVPPRERDVFYENVFMTWAEHDFTGAMAEAQGIADLGIRSRALRAALYKRVETEPREVLDFLRSSKLGDLRSSVGNYAIQRWLEKDLAAARDYVLSLPPSEMRETQITRIAQEMANRDPREALTWIDQVPESDRERAAESLFWIWGSKDSKAASEAARGLPDGPLKEKAVARVIDTLIVNDRTAAINLLQDLPAGLTRDTALNQIASGWALEDPHKAIEWYMENTGDNQRGELAKIVAEWSQKDPDGAFDWAFGLPEGPQKGSLVAQTIFQLMRNDPASATALVEKLPVESQRSAIQNLAEKWGYRDTRAATEWVLTLRDETAKSNAIGALAGQWGSWDPVAAARWIEKLPAGASRDAAVASFSFSTSKTDPEGAVTWATTIQNPDKNRSTIRNVYATWLRKDPAAAGSWLQSATSISPELRSELQGMSITKTVK
jgi:hypothetical protein